MKMVYIVGVGMDGMNTLTAEAREAICSADILVGAKRMTDMFADSGKTVYNTYHSTEIAKLLESEKFEIAAVLMSGDCGFYSGAAGLLPMLSEYKTEVICGISSPVYFASKLGISWQNMRFISLHGAEDNIVRNAASNEKTFFLLGGKVTASDICRRLCEYGLGEITVHIGECLANENERIQSGKASDFTEIDTDRLAVLMTVNPKYQRNVRFGIDDGFFQRGSVPMTKSEIRGAIISKLDIRPDDICWDIGCGTGSVSVEMALQCSSGRVYSVDRNEEACRLTKANAHRFYCDNITVYCGMAGEIIPELPKPDRLFIGGSCGELEKILHRAYELNPEVKTVITAVSLETLSSAVKLLEQSGNNTDVVQIAVTRTKKIGEHTMLSAENPVYIITSSENC
ncbi:MAG: precorrin-6y C5,15-methyltransferase (decarboxylating) subunit CbiE [Huintestinicola sp.]